MFIYILFIHFSQAAQLLCTHQWAVKLDSDEEATNLALKYGMANLGLIVDSYYLIEAPILIERDATNIHDSKLVKREWNGVPASHIFPRTFKEVEETLGTLDFIAQVPRERKKRNIVKESPTDLTYFDDPLYSKQWHLYNNGDNGNIAGNDINVAPVWKQGINGSGVIVSVIDDGVDFTHPDLADSWSRNSSFDFTTRNANPAPKDITDTHGTRCAGEIGARPNQGIA
jgi:subtilisin family serine protease